MDELLFQSGGWFAIDASNQRVGGVVVPSLRAGLPLVGKAPVATLVGRLRPEVVVVDIDLAGQLGHAVAEAIVAWCAGEDLWRLVRPSGGADGRAHVFVAPEGRQAALEALLTQLRASHRLARTALELRASVRPLSAPHRSGTGTATTPYGPLKQALAGLRGHSWARDARPASDPRQPAAVPRPGRPPAQPLTPRQARSRQPLPPAWQAFLDTGERPPLHPPPPGAAPHTRSTWEAIATASMLRAGYTAEDAWQAIQHAHPTAMDHARADRHRWTQWVWNRAVRDDDAYTPPRRRDPAVETALEHARHQLRALAWSVPPRQRPALLRVGYAVLDRMHRTCATRVPVPERDLVLDTGIADRKTIRTQLRRMNGPVGQLDTTTFDPVHARDCSSFEFAIHPPPNTPPHRVMSQLPPPSRHTPLPPGAWASLPQISHQLWRALERLTEPVDLVTVAQQGQVTATPSSSLSPRQARTTTAALTALAQVGLVGCTEGGQWFARAGFEPDRLQQATARHAEFKAAIDAERAAYRATREGAWSRARAAALKAQRARQQAWWAGLKPGERRERRQTWQAKFAALTVHDQAILKSRLAERDLAAGVDPGARHDTWLDSMPMDTYLHRSQTRAGWFALLPRPLQAAHVQAWQTHRAQYGIRRGTALATSRREHADALPRGEQHRDATFWTQHVLPLDEPARPDIHQPAG